MSGLETTTRWLDKKITKLDEADKIIRSEHEDEMNPNGTSYLNWVITPSFEKSQSTSLVGNFTFYQVYKFSFYQVPQGSTIDDSLTPYSGWVLAYELNQKVHYIINRNTYSKLILRKMLKYTGRNELIQETTRAYGDLFVWLISKVYTQNNTIEKIDDNLPDIIVDEIRGFKGRTEDSLNTVSAEGPSVMNILSTLSFLVESQNLRQVTFDLRYSDMTSIEVMLSTSNTVAVDLNQYMAMHTNINNEAQAIAIVFLTFYLEILPVIVQNYISELESGNWGKNGCVNFLQQVAHALSEKVKLRIGDLKSNPDQLIFNKTMDKEEHEEEQADS
ncbi:hypothetical protein ACTQ1N_12120 [Porcincola sp. LCP21S3_C12]|uniref:hypothetical protein n=1 Tax=Porcincola sp. LCP21S3_C12 TaxID=3438798 RepID=UPI003F97B89D